MRVCVSSYTIKDYLSQQKDDLQKKKKMMNDAISSNSINLNTIKYKFNVVKEFIFGPKTNRIRLCMKREANNLGEN